MNELAVQINHLHRECWKGVQTTLQIAIQIGGLLIEQKKECQHGTWIPWIKTNLIFSEVTAQRYMSCFHNRAKASSTTLFTIEEFARTTEPTSNKSTGCALIPFDLNRGAFGVDRKHQRTFFIQPCGKNGIYVKWCHILINHHQDDGSMRFRTLEGVWEPEIEEWIHEVGGVTTNHIDWYPGIWEPTPDTYRVDTAGDSRND